MNSNYHCSHCGHRFKDEDKDVVECPKCFWSSSVKKSVGKAKDDVLGQGADKVFHVKKKKSRKTIVLFALLLLVALMIYFGLSFFGKENKSAISKPSNSNVGKKISLDIASESLLKEKENLPVVAPVVKEEDFRFLTSKLSFEEVFNSLRVPKDLSKPVSFKVGLVERLPSQSWNYEQFEEMIKQQEAFYKVTLTRGYKKELREHFEKHYEQGRVAFEAAQLLRARDEFVKALAFPIYSDDPKRHRVALTMLKSFINDTLSKIGALNTMLVDEQLRGQEKKIQSECKQLLQLIESQLWDEALLKIKSMQASINALQNQNLNELQAPNYPAGLIGLDPGIGASLADLQKPSQTLLSDLNPLSRDLVNKYHEIEKMSEKSIREQLERYNQASLAIENKNWDKALELLSLFKNNDILFERAQQKKQKLLDLGLVKTA